MNREMNGGLGNMGLAVRSETTTTYIIPLAYLKVLNLDGKTATFEAVANHT